MKRSTVLQHLRKHGCVLKFEGGSHSLWMNSTNGAVEAVPRHAEIPNILSQLLDGILSSGERPRPTRSGRIRAILGDMIARDR